MATPVLSKTGLNGLIKRPCPLLGLDIDKYPLLLLAAGFIISLALSGCGHFQSAGNPDHGPIITAIDFYRGPLNHLSAVRAGACPMYPGCSDYSRRAIEAHGPIIGWIMACDRLMRCGRDELDEAPRMLVDGEPKYFDPLSRNDWWWYEPDRIDPLKSSRRWQISID